MSRLVLTWVLIFSAALAGAQTTSFKGQVDWGRSLASFESSPPVPQTLYLVTAMASEVRITSEEPFVAAVTLMESTWADADHLVSSRVSVRFAGEGWKALVTDRRPRNPAAGSVFPGRTLEIALEWKDGQFQAVGLLGTR